MNDMISTGTEDLGVVEGEVLSRDHDAELPELSPKSRLAALDAGISAEDLRDQVQNFGQRDPEAGHALTEDLMRSVLEAIRDGHPSPQRLARDVLIVEEAEFSRWFA